MTQSLTIPHVLPRHLPRVCDDLPRCGGRYKTHPEDFQVDELAPTAWAGRGDYLYLRIEARQLAAPTMRQLLQHILDVPFPAIRLAGRKDKRAVTRQWVSIEGGDEAWVPKIEAYPLREGQALRVLDVTRHTVPMSFGVHGGNRFRIVLRGYDPLHFDTTWENAQRIAERLQHTGVPNFYGEQRLYDDNAELGREILLDMFEKVPSSIARFHISSYQSQLFNNVLAHRMNQGLWRTVLEGDWMRENTVHQRPTFVPCDAAHLAHWQREYDSFRYAVTGPMFGPGMLQSSGIPGLWEALALQQEGLRLDEFYNEEFLYPRGLRRSIRLPVQDFRLTAGDQRTTLHLDFVLSPGGYATIVLREFGATHSPRPSAPPPTGQE